MRLTRLRGGSVLLIIVLMIGIANAAVLYVDDDGVCGGNAPCYTIIQSAVSAASDDDIISIYNGFYSDEIIINKRLILQGQDKNNVFIVNNASVDTLTINSNNVSIKGVTINNTAGDGYGCIWINPDFDFISIEDNILNQGYYGIFADNHVQNLIINGNVFRDCNRAIFARECSSNEIAPIIDNNEFYDSVYGIKLYHIYQGNSQVQIYNNYFEELAEDSTAYGIYAYLSSIDAINNTFEKYGMCGMDFWTHGGAIAFVGSTSIPGWQDVKRSEIRDNTFNVWKGSAIEGYFADPLIVNNVINKLSGGFEIGIWIRGGTGWDPGSGAYGMWTIENVTFNGANDGDGMFTTGGGYGMSAFSVNNSYFSNWENGIRMVTDGDKIDYALITESDFTNNDVGIYVADDTRNVTVKNNSISGNVDFGLKNDASGNVSAEYNWWGSSLGPGGDGPGNGDSVGSNVIFDNWITMDNDADGYYADVDDCHDNSAAINPGATEICDNLDNDCDGDVDEGDVCENDNDDDSGSSGKGCKTEWTCTEYSDCVNGQKNRTCTKIWVGCEPEIEKPPEINNCTVKEDPEPIKLPLATAIISNSSEKTWLILLNVILIAVISLSYILILKRVGVKD